MTLKKLYLEHKMSAADIAKQYSCSQSKVNYWIKKHKIPKRNISDAIYQKKNPAGDPFTITEPTNIKESFLYGLGIGLYWGEGNKANKHTVRIGNSDPVLLEAFIQFLNKFYGVKRHSLKVHLHLFTDINPTYAQNFWMRTLRLKKKQFYKPTITQSEKLGTYNKKSKYGVLTLYYGNKKLREIIITSIQNTGENLSM